jgi:hypothetical protein
MGHKFAQISLLILALSVCISAPSVAKDPATLPADADMAADESFKAVEPLIGAQGQKHDGVLTFHIPRKDLEGRLFNELGDIPIAAGIEARFDFFKCPCGKVNVMGQFVVTQDELNDVIDALRKTYYIKVVSIAPMMLGEKPRLQIIRFQGDGQAETLASYLKNALNQIGDARLTPTTQP